MVKALSKFTNLLVIVTMSFTLSSKVIAGTQSVLWQEKASIPHKVQEIYPTEHNGELVVAGGLTPQDKAFITDKTFIYNPDDNQWRGGPNLPEPRHHPNLVSFKGALYAFGGFVQARQGNGQWHASRDV